MRTAPVGAARDQNMPVVILVPSPPSWNRRAIWPAKQKAAPFRPADSPRIVAFWRQDFRLIRKLADRPPARLSTAMGSPSGFRASALANHFHSRRASSSAPGTEPLTSAAATGRPIHNVEINDCGLPVHSSVQRRCGRPESSGTTSSRQRMICPKDSSRWSAGAGEIRGHDETALARCQRPWPSSGGFATGRASRMNRSKGLQSANLCGMRVDGQHPPRVNQSGRRKQNCSLAIVSSTCSTRSVLNSRQKRSSSDLTRS